MDPDVTSEYVHLDNIESITNSIQQFHLTCLGLLEKEAGGWFCDVCRESTGFPVEKRRCAV